MSDAARAWFVTVIFTALAISDTFAASFVWRVTGANNAKLYLGGSVHALRTTDYPIPAAFKRALDDSAVLALEVDPKQMKVADQNLVKIGTYPKGDSLKNHVDPRTYDYISRLFGLLNVPREKAVQYRPWLLSLMLQSPTMTGGSMNLGVEQFLIDRAKASSKPIVGLESSQEHVEVLSKLNDREGEALLLLNFIPADPTQPNYARIMSAWHNGEADLPWRVTHDGFRDFPSLGERIVEGRNRNWIPRIEAYMASGKTYFVVAGAAHIGGPGGLIALLRARGFEIEQL